MAYEGPIPYSIANGGTGVVTLAPLIQAQTGTNAAWQTTTATMPNSSIPQNSDGAEHVTVSITPKSSSNVLRISFTLFAYCDNIAQFVVALFQDSTANALYAAEYRDVVSGVNDVAAFHGYYTMTAGTTSATTFKLRFGSTDGTLVAINGSGGSRFLGGASISNLTVMEFGT